MRRTWIRLALTLASVMLLLAGLGCGDDDDGDGNGNGNGNGTAEPSVSVSFVEPSDGDTVAATFSVEMAAEGLTVEPAGEVNENAGHFHILVDTDFIAAGEAIPADDQHVHFGDASTETELTLEPGSHTLRLQFADGTHTALEGDEYRDEITVTVE